jgi:hypothetical protein
MAASAREPLKQLEDHLAAQLGLAKREADFDMDDAPEETVLAPFVELHDALRWLSGHVVQKWRVADQDALRSQTRHQLLARVAIGSGTAAIVLAIAQLSIKLTLPWLTTAALGLDLIAILAAVAAVLLGVIAKYNRGWLGQRHLAERLRMLKFRALEQLWCHDRPSWEKWVTKELHSLNSPEDFGAVREWSEGGEVEADVPAWAGDEPNRQLWLAFAAYYRSKRLDFQAKYFSRRRDAYESQIGGWRRHLNLPLFFASVICVLAHFALEAGAINQSAASAELSGSWDEILAVWFVALAAIIPVMGLGIRAFFAAFELPRSASLYAAKQQALVNAAKRLSESRNFAAGLSHIAQDEHFLEDEHREWLRLLIDTEWFL